MSNIRAGMTKLKDPDDDYAYQILKGDVERLRLMVEKVALNQLDPSLFSGIERISVTVCVDGVEMTMTVLGTQPE